MSRIGKQPITVPGGVDVTIDGPVVRVKGPKGELEHTVVGGVTVARDGDALVVGRIDDSRTNRSLHGLQRTLIANMVTGVSEGFVRELDIVGAAMNQLSEQVEAQLAELTHQAFYDRLTNLPNRVLFKDRLTLATARAARRNRCRQTRSRTAWIGGDSSPGASP